MSQHHWCYFASWNSTAQKGLVLCSCACGGDGHMWAPAMPCSPSALWPPEDGWLPGSPGHERWEETTSSKFLLLSGFKGAKSTSADIPPSQHSQEESHTFMLLKRVHFFPSEWTLKLLKEKHTLNCTKDTAKNFGL